MGDSSFLFQPGLGFFLQNEAPRFVEELPSSRKRHTPSDPVPAGLKLTDAIGKWLAPSEGGRPGQRNLHLCYLGVADGDGSSACCHVAEQAALQEKRYPHEILSLRRGINELPGVIHNPRCVREMVRQLRAHQPSGARAKPGTAKTILWVVFAILLLAAGAWATAGGTLQGWLGAGFFSALAAIFTGVASSYIERHLGPELIKELCQATSDEAKVKDAALYRLLVTTCAKYLAQSPKIIIVDCFPQLDLFSKSVLLAFLTSADLTRWCLLKLFITEPTSNSEFGKELLVREVGRPLNLPRVHSWRLSPLKRDAQLKLARAARTEGALAEDSLPVKTLLEYTPRVEGGEEDISGETVPGDCSSGPGPMDVLRAGSCGYGNTISHLEFTSFCHSGDWPEIFRLLKLKPISRTMAERFLDGEARQYPGLTQSSSLNLDILSSRAPAQARVRYSGICHLAWCYFWGRRLQRHPLEGRLAKEVSSHARRMQVPVILITTDDGRTLLVRLFEFLTSAARHCMALTDFPAAASIVERMLGTLASLRDQASVQQEMDSVEFLERIVMRVVWNSALATGDRATFVRALQGESGVGPADTGGTANERPLEFYWQLLGGGPRAFARRVGYFSRRIAS